MCDALDGSEEAIVCTKHGSATVFSVALPVAESMRVTACWACSIHAASVVYTAHKVRGSMHVSAVTIVWGKSTVLNSVTRLIDSRHCCSHRSPSSLTKILLHAPCKCGRVPMIGIQAREESESVGFLSFVPVCTYRVRCHQARLAVATYEATSKNPRQNRNLPVR